MEVTKSEYGPDEDEVEMDGKGSWRTEIHLPTGYLGKKEDGVYNNGGIGETEGETREGLCSRCAGKNELKHEYPTGPLIA
jgi:hypothetical protein